MTWKAPPELAEAKHFAIAIYNILVLGGISYFLSIFIGASNASAAVLLRCLGIFASSTAAVAVIVTPKLLVIEGLIKPGFTSSTSGHGRSSGESVNDSHEPDRSSVVAVPTTSPPKAYQPPVDDEGDNKVHGEEDDDESATSGSHYIRADNYAIGDRSAKSAASSSNSNGLFVVRANARVVPGDDGDVFTSNVQQME